MYSSVDQSMSNSGRGIQAAPITVRKAHALRNVLLACIGAMGLFAGSAHAADLWRRFTTYLPRRLAWLAGLTWLTWVRLLAHWSSSLVCGQ